MYVCKCMLIYIRYDGLILNQLNYLFYIKMVNLLLLLWLLYFYFASIFCIVFHATTIKFRKFFKNCINKYTIYSIGLIFFVAVCCSSWKHEVKRKAGERQNKSNEQKWIIFFSFFLSLFRNRVLSLFLFLDTLL